MAGQEGLEPPTRGFGVRCSTDWSYCPAFGLACFSVCRVLVTPRTKLFQLNPVRVVFLVFHGGVIAFFTINTSHRNNGSHCCATSFGLPQSVVHAPGLSWTIIEEYSMGEKRMSRIFAFYTVFLANQVHGNTNTLYSCMIDLYVSPRILKEVFVNTHPQASVLLLVLATLLWSGNFVAGRFLAGAISPFFLQKSF